MRISLAMILAALLSVVVLSTADAGDNDQIQSSFPSIELSLPYLRGSEAFIRHAYDPLSNTLYVLDHGRDFLFRIQSDGKVDTLLTGILADETSLFLMDVNRTGDYLYFWEEEVGKVFKLSLSTLAMRRIDETTIEKLMRGHTAIFCPDELIYAFSGYGVWEEKNFMLYFNEEIKGWLKIDHEGPRPPRSENAFMAFEQGIDRFHVLLPKTEQRREFIYYQFDRYEPEWKEIADIHLPSSFSLPEHQVIASHTYRFDQQNGLFHVMGNTFFNVSTAMLLRAEGSTQGDLLETVYYFNPTLKEWLRVGIIERDEFLKLQLMIIPADNLWLNPVTKRAIYPNRYLLFISIFVLALVIFILLFTRTSHNDVTSPQKRIKLVRNSYGVQVYINGSLSNVPEPRLNTFWELIYRMIEEHQTIMQLSELNKALFDEERLDAHVSRVRSKLIRLVQDQVGKEVIWIEKDKLDKRFKVIRINPDMMETGE